VTKMTPEEHKARHELLHKHLDELVADFISLTDRLPSMTTLLEFMKWSYAQTIKPDEEAERQALERGR
jgi:hypothetical protein